MFLEISLRFFEVIVSLEISMPLYTIYISSENVSCGVFRCKRGSRFRYDQILR